MANRKGMFFKSIEKMIFDAKENKEDTVKMEYYMTVEMKDLMIQRNHFLKFTVMV